ncbi:alpha amylase catalytic subunit [Geothermobacter ehrlichii]|uniref:Alpha amylase catalytic subunit n=1 Tax=Geothermobacter ehrlichii TaxID=213224 RepID=A0A5D3WKZ7_9BACT|nr:alpha-amylase family glycosyl hydrolase [Geothermobacter ehrlichii]TYO99072.1 alpha amylase catalytic subunit [Geothermobacter ehrlichii]
MNRHGNSLRQPFPISDKARRRLRLDERLADCPREHERQRLFRIAGALRECEGPNVASGSELLLLAALCRAQRHLCRQQLHRRQPPADSNLELTLIQFRRLFPPAEADEDAPQAETIARLLPEIFILASQNDNPAAAGARSLFDDSELETACHYRRLLQLPLEEAGEGSGRTLYDLICEPLRRQPDSLADQLRWVRRHWQPLLPAELLAELDAVFEAVSSEMRRPTGGAGPPQPPGLGGHESDGFTPEADWMADVVLIAKSIRVWMYQLGHRYQTEVRTLDDIPDTELEQLAACGFNALWLIGLWERSPASAKIKRLRGNRDAAASAYALFDYDIAAEIGGDAAFDRFRHRCRRHGILLCGDVVPNHFGLDSRWLRDHPERFVQTDHPPFPGYSFTGPDLSGHPDIELVIEDGYWDHSDAAVVFRHVDRRSGRTRYIYHGNDGTHLPWNDTAQLDYLRPDVREAMIELILQVAKRFDLIRFDAAMTLAKRHFQRLWYPLPGGGSGVPSRAMFALTAEEFDRAFPQEFWRQVVDRLAAEAPDTLLLAEAFWMLEGYFVRELGMHRVYNSAFMNMLKHEENARYHRVIRDTLACDRRILQRFVNFMNNPDEATAVEQFGKGDKYFAVAVLLATLPGLPLFGHGQVEGLREKYGMEFVRPLLDEERDEGFFRHHQSQIFPLLRRRRLFSGADSFRFYDFVTDTGCDENVFAFSNGHGDERVLVVVNNSPHPTAGRIRFAVSRSAEDRTVAKQSPELAEALAPAVQKMPFLSGREIREGKKILLHLPTLRREGLRLELGPYQYRVLLHLKPLPDADGSLQRLWREQTGGNTAWLDLDDLAPPGAPEGDCAKLPPV